MNEVKIAEVLFSYYQKLLKHYPEGSILGCFLFGSQNYNFSWEGSDIDAKAIYIPTMEEMINLKEPVSKVYETPTGNIEVKDIRLMWKMWKKQNMNFIEILFTDYYLTNNDYTDLWEEIRNFNNEIAHYDPQYTITSAYHQVYHTITQATTGKKIANAARMAIFLNNYINLWNNYKSCITLTSRERELLLPYKIENKEFEADYHMIATVKEDLNNALAMLKKVKTDSELQKKLDKKMTSIIVSLINIRKGIELSKI